MICNKTDLQRRFKIADIDIYFLKDFFYLLSERQEGREKEGVKHQYVVASHTPPTGGLDLQPRHVF